MQTKRILSTLQIIAVILTLSLLTACGGDGGGATGGTTGAPAGTVVTKVDPNDKNNYFAVIDGKKYSFYDDFTMQDLLDDGYTADPACDMEREVKPGVYVGESLFDINISMFKKGVEKYYFKAYPVNLTDAPVPLKDCNVYGIYFFNKEANIKIAGGLTVGITQKNFKDVFGEPGTKAEIPGYKDRYGANYTTADSYGVFSFEFTENPDEVKAIAVSYAPR